MKTTKILKWLSMLAVMFGFMSCDDDIVYPNLTGEWQWVKSSGGFFGEVKEPEYKSIIKISEQNKYETYVEDTLYAAGTFKFYTDDSHGNTVKIEPSIIPVRPDAKRILTYGNDTIVFSEGCCDRWDFYYVRVQEEKQ